MLPHFTRLKTAVTLAEAVYPSLFEITFITPNAVRSKGYDEVLLLENATSIDLEELTQDIEIAEQRFKYSTRTYLALPSKSHAEFSIPFNWNIDVNGANPVWNCLRAWYDLAWNSQTGESSYKRDMVGTVIVNQHDKAGFVIRRITFINVQLRGIDGYSLEWESTSDIIKDKNAKFVADYWIDEYIDSDNEISEPNRNVYIS